jgi:iron complex outermembrane recepter protein
MSESNSRRGARLAMAVAAMLGTSLPTLGLAQIEPSGAPERGTLQEIVVTATRHEEALSRVPISVTALSQDMMDQKGIKDISDVVRFTPGVSIDAGGTNQISIRGISSSGGAGTTGIYIDDTPIQMRSVGFNPDDALPKTFDLDRVEVLRGPQGTLFGAGSEGGTVRYILTQPKVRGESTYARGELSFTHYGEPSYEAGIAHGDALIDGTLGYRANVWYRRDGGWINRVDPTTGAETEHGINRAGALMLRLAALWQPIDALSVTPSVIYQNSKKHDQSTYWPAYSDPAEGRFNSATPERMPIPDEYYLPSLKIEIDLAHSQIFSNTSYYHRDQRDAYQGSVYDFAFFQSMGWPPNANYPGSPYNYVGGIQNCGSASTTLNFPCSWYPLLDARGIHLPAGFANYSTPNQMTNQQRSYTQEIRWQSNEEGSRLHWTVGVFWQLARELSVEELKAQNINGLFQALYGVNATDLFFPGQYNCGAFVTPGLAFPACDIYYNRNVTFDRQIAGFGELSYALTDQLRLTVGDRYAKTSFDLEHYSDGLENFGPSVKSGSQREKPNTPKISLSDQLNSANLFYATWAKGFRVGGGNGPLPPYCNADLAGAGYPNGAPLTYKSDSTSSLEVGSKNSFGPAFRIASSVYYIKWKDIQQNVYIAGACGLQFIDNLGTAVAKGFDMQAELAAGPMQFEAAIGYTDARYTANSTHAGLAHTGDAISGQGAIDYAPGLNPPWTAAVGAQFNFGVREHEAFVRLDYEYASRNHWPSTLQDSNSTQFNPNTYALSSTSFASLRAGVAMGEWSFSAFIDNLFDSHTVTTYALGQIDPYNNTYPPTGTNGRSYQLSFPTSVQQNAFTFRPRTVGVTVSYRTK